MGLEVQKTKKDSQTLIQEWVGEYQGEKPIFMWAIVLKKFEGNSEETAVSGPIGMICFHQFSPPCGNSSPSSFSSELNEWIYGKNSWWIRYILGEQFWNKGYITEAVQCALSFFLYVMNRRSVPALASYSPSPESFCYSSEPSLSKASSFPCSSECSESSSSNAFSSSSVCIPPPFLLFGCAADRNPASQKVMLSAEGFMKQARLSLPRTGKVWKSMELSIAILLFLQRQRTQKMKRRGRGKRKQRMKRKRIRRMGGKQRRKETE